MSDAEVAVKSSVKMLQHQAASHTFIYTASHMIDKVVVVSCKINKISTGERMMTTHERVKNGKMYTKAK